MRAKTLFATLLAAAVGLAMSGPLAAQEAKKERKPASGSEEAKARPEGQKVEVARSLRASQIVGETVKNKAGKDLGTVNDLVVELNSGEIRYAAISFGGFAGLGDKLFAVPWQAMTFKFGEDDRYFVFDATEAELKQKQGFDENKWPDVADPKWAASIDAQYKIDRTKREEGAEVRKPAEKKAGENVVYDAVFRLSTIKGMNVRNNAGKDLGHVEEVVIDLNKGKINYAALSFGGLAGLGDKLFAIPFHEFKLKHAADEKHFVVNIPEEKLRKAPGFDENRWPDTANPNWASEIDRYYQAARTAERPAAPRND
jgi:sporulation protein YlmC with PRC-barrel domain